MWHHLGLQKDHLTSGSRMTRTVLPQIKNQLPSRAKPQQNQLLPVDHASTLTKDLSQVPATCHNTTGHLRARYTELSQWQTYIYETLCQVDHEIAAVSQMKGVMEHCLLEKQLYSQHIGGCVALSDSLSSSSPVQRQDSVLSNLKKEEQLTNESRELLQRNIHILLDKLSSLQKIHGQLQVDFQDKSEAMKLTSRCITYSLNTPGVQLPAIEYIPTHISYDEWLSRCKTLRSTAGNLVESSSLFRRNMRQCLVHLKNSQESLTHNTQSSMRKRINKLTRIQETLNWERQRIVDEISDLTDDVRRASNQIRNCDSRLHRPTHCLDLLSHRPRYELCLDFPHISLTLERQDLEKMAGGFSTVLKCAQEDLEVAHRRLANLEDKLAQNAQLLQVQQRCHKLHQSFQLALHNAVILANKSKLNTAASSSRTHTNLQ